MNILVGTFRSPVLYTLSFDPSAESKPTCLSVSHTSKAAAGHSWLAISLPGKYLYTTNWSSPPSVGAYEINADATVTLLNTAPVKSLSGYVVASAKHLFSVGGPKGEVFALESDGRIGRLVQQLSFRTQAELDDGVREGVKHGNFGGLRHGSHSVDLSPDGKQLYVADIGHNCVWTYSVDESEEAVRQSKVLVQSGKYIAPSPKDGPRHTWPHPAGRVLYSLQEHSSLVTVLKLVSDTKGCITSLDHAHSVKILPSGENAEDFWADEVRLSEALLHGGDTKKPKYLFASTRGLDKEKPGYVAAFKLDEEGMVESGGEPVDAFQTETSGGLANAISVMPLARHPFGSRSADYIALTDSQEGFVFMLKFEQSIEKLIEVGRVKLKLPEGVGEAGEVAQAATAVWL